jgi:hypothetical protein
MQDKRRSVSHASPKQFQSDATDSLRTHPMGGEQHCIMVALRSRKRSGHNRRRSLTGNNPLCPLDGGEGDKAAQTAAFLLRRLLQQSTFFLGVVGEHFRSKWGLALAPGRSVLPFGYRLLRYYRTTLWNSPRGLAVIWAAHTDSPEYHFPRRLHPRRCSPGRGLG